MFRQKYSYGTSDKDDRQKLCKEKKHVTIYLLSISWPSYFSSLAHKLGRSSKINYHARTWQIFIKLAQKLMLTMYFTKRVHSLYLLHYNFRCCWLFTNQSIFGRILYRAQRRSASKRINLFRTFDLVPVICENVISCKLFTIGRIVVC